MSLALLLALGFIVFASCSNLRYYTHTLWGGMKVWSKQRSIAALLGDPELPAALKSRLALVVKIRDFATTELGLPDNGSYTQYADLGRPYAVWNVVAAPELAVDPLVWCFPIAGCVSYRGYFSEGRANKFASGLRHRGYDVSVAGVTAYSTLGWLKDPVLNTFLEWPEADLAGLVFHELAHQSVYLKDDTTFNESFATVVELEGVRRWLGDPDRRLELEAYQAGRDRQEEFVALVLRYRSLLADAYVQPRPEDWKRRRKDALLKELGQEYLQVKASWGGDPSYDGWFQGDLNNAHLASVGAYHDLVPAFTALLRRAGVNLPAFLAEVRSLAQLPQEERTAVLADLRAAESLANPR